MKWVTWENVAVDRMACAWLIRKQIDAQAEFIFVPVGTKPLPDGAEPFDIPGVRYSHQRGHCTFFALLDLLQKSFFHSTEERPEGFLRAFGRFFQPSGRLFQQLCKRSIERTQA